MRFSTCWYRAALAAAVAACTEGHTPTTQPAQRTAFDRVSASQEAADPGFAFLPPLAPEPATSSALDGSLSPEVQVCVWSGPACLYPLVTDLPAVAVAGDHYAVNWQTAASGLLAGRSYRIRVLVGADELGHLDVVAGASAADLKDVDPAEAFALVIGRTVPIKFRIPQGAVSCDTIQMIAVNDFALPLKAGMVPTAPGGSTGLTFFQGTQVMYAGGVLFGTSVADLLVGYDVDYGRSSFAHGPICADRHGAFFHTAATVAPDTAGAGPAGLKVTQESFAYASAPDGGYVLLKYTFTNTGTTPIASFYSGWMADWDLYFDSGSKYPMATDRIRYDAALGLGEATEWDTLAYPAMVGIVPVGPSGTFAFHGFCNGCHKALTTTDYFAFLSGGINLRVPGGPSDVREMMGLAPLTISAGHSTVAYFALVGGADRQAFEANVAAAEVKAAALGY